MASSSSEQRDRGSKKGGSTRAGENEPIGQGQPQGEPGSSSEPRQGQNRPVEEGEPKPSRKTGSSDDAEASDDEGVE